MTAELGSNLPPEVTAFHQESVKVIGDLQDLAGTIPSLSINIHLKQLPERVKQLLIFAGVPQESNSQISYYYRGDPAKIYVSLHGRYERSSFRFNWFPQHPNAISGLTISPEIRNLGDYTGGPYFSFLKIKPEYSGPPTEDTRKRYESLQVVIPDPTLGNYHLELLQDLSSFTKHCADILSGNMLRPES